MPSVRTPPYSAQVFNLTTYPNLVGFFEELGVDAEPSDMSFALSVDNGRCKAHFFLETRPQMPRHLVSGSLCHVAPSALSSLRRLEWGSDGLAGLFAQRKNIWSPSFLRMIWDILRFGRDAPKVRGQEV